MGNETAGGRSSRVLEALSEPTRTGLKRFLDESPLDAGVLARRVRAYAAEVANETGVVDQWTANLVAWKCLALLERLDGAGEEARNLIQAAVLYFVEQTDAEDDLDSPVGFDDDLEVVDAIARELGFREVTDMEGA